MYGIDLSNWQRGIDLSRNNFDFAIVKATEGVGFVDKSFDNFVFQLTELGKLMGFYHFARPDLNNSRAGIHREAEYFISELTKRDLIGKGILVLDWETEPMDNEDYINEWVKTVESITGITPWIYGSRSKLKKWKEYWAVNHCPIWMAAWPSTMAQYAGGPFTGSFPTQATPWKIWQYSSTGRFNGFTGNVDLDYTTISAKQWIEMSNRPSPPEPEPEIISGDMQWAIDLGLFTGYGNHKFGPQDPLTREQLAIVLRRYNKLIDGINIK